MDLALDLFIKLAVIIVFIGMTSLAAAWALLRGFKPGAVVLTASLGLALFFGALFFLVQSNLKQDTLPQFQQYFNDGWTMGYTPFVSLGVWVGNNDDSSTTNEGVGLAAPIWNKVMQKLLTSHPVQTFTPPAPLQSANPILVGQFPAGDPPHSILYYINKNDPENTTLPNPNTDPQYPAWEAAVRSYINPPPTQPIPTN